MKAILLLTVLFGAITASAKNGGNQPMTPDRFLEESIEYSIAMTKMTGAVVASVSTQSVDADTMIVAVSATNGSLYSYECNIVDDFSNGGTVVKKDVLCTAY